MRRRPCGGRRRLRRTAECTSLCSTCPSCIARTRTTRPRPKSASTGERREHMGYGEWVGNESVHFTVVYEDKEGRETGSVKGRDPISLGSVGTNKKRKLTRGSVRVQVRYATLEAAER